MLVHSYIDTRILHVHSNCKVELFCKEVFNIQSITTTPVYVERSDPTSTAQSAIAEVVEEAITCEPYDVDAAQTPILWYDSFVAYYSYMHVFFLLDIVL